MIRNPVSLLIFNLHNNSYACTKVDLFCGFIVEGMFPFVSLFHYSHDDSFVFKLLFHLVYAFAPSHGPVFIRQFMLQMVLGI